MPTVPTSQHISLDPQLQNQNQTPESPELTEKLRSMALVPNPPVNEGPLFAEVDMGADASAPTVRATVVQASTVFYDTPATLGSV